METLVELPVEKWPVLQEKLKDLWPLNVAGYYAIHVNLKYPRLREAFQFKVYCPLGDMDKGFVAVNVKPEGSQDCILFPTTRDMSYLEQALVNTKLIDWTRMVCIDCVSSITLKSLDKVRLLLGFKLYDVGMVKTFFLDQKTRIFEDIRLPEGTCVAPIKQEDLQHVNNVWPFKSPNSIIYFSVLATNGLSYGLYSNNKLLAWVFINEYNFLCHLYCEEDHRRKGFAEFIMKYVINEQLEEGNDIYAYVCDGNETPIGLFQKLGFVDVDRGAYIFAKK